MLKTTKEFDFVYKNSYKFRSESLDICVLKPNLAGQFYEKFRKIPCSLVGFSVSKKVGNAVERNLIKRRLRAICREFFGMGNLFWGMQFAPFSHKTALDERSSSISLVSRKNGAKPHRHYFDCDSLHESTTNQAQNCNNLSLRESQSDSNDSRGSILEIKSGFCETSNEDKTNSLSRKRVEAIHDFSPPSGLQGVSRSKKDNRANLICIFIAKSAILQTPFIALKSTTFATLKKQMRFMNNAHSAPKMANRYESHKRESTKMANRPKSHTQGLMQNENR